MLLTLSTTHPPAADLGFLLHKHPDRVQRFPLSFGTAHVFYPEASAARCTAALLVEVDPIGLVRRRGGPEGSFALQQYVNDRPYAASSFLAVALGEVFGTALSGRCEQRPQLAASALPFELRIAALPCRGGDTLLRRLFEPLGYTVQAERLPLDPAFPEWGDSPYFGVVLETRARLCEVLQHLCVLVPVLDDDKHYWVGRDEVEKLLRRGKGWLAGHPEREEIAARYLRHQRGLVRSALGRLADDGTAPADDADSREDEREASVERPISLAAQREGAVLALLRQHGARSVADLGCGEGRLLRALLGEPQLERVTGLDVSLRALEIAGRRLGLERMAPRKRARVELLHGSLGYRDARLEGFDAVTLIEVIEHLDPSRLGALERVVFECARPRLAVVTTPNAEYNARFETLPAGQFRHRDHRFEWTRAEFAEWCDGVAARRGYAVRRSGVGSEDAALGAPTQLAVFERG